MEFTDCLQTDMCRRVVNKYSVEDRAAVAVMPTEWVPRRTGPVLVSYLKQRELDHQAILQNLTKDAAKLNAEIDAEIRILAENLRTTIQDSQTAINCIMGSYNIMENPLTIKSRDEEVENVNQVTCQRVQEIGLFKRDALLLERKRAERLRKLLRDNFQKLIAVGNRTPKELLHYFDERTYEANQQLLSNFRAYTELEAKLRAQADASDMRARTFLHQLYLGIQLSVRRRSSQVSRKTSSNRASYSASDSGNRESLDLSIKDVLGGVGEFDECVRLIVDAYKNALLKIFNGFSVKLKDLRESLGKSDREEFATNIFETLELCQTIEQNLRRLSNCVKSKLNSSKNPVAFAYDDAQNLQKTMGSLAEQLRMTYDILNDAGHLWDAHIMRSALAQKLTTAAAEDTLTSNDFAELANEVSLGIVLEKLRTAPDPDTLQHNYQELVDLLDKTAALYRSHSEAEIRRLEEFMNLPVAMADTLLAEFNCFLARHPRDLPPSSSSTIAVQSSGTLTQRDSTSLTLPLPRVMLLSDLQCKALQNWKNGFLESFQSNISLVPDELKAQARSWVDEKIAILNVRYSMKVMSHSVRLERVKAVHEARLAELTLHEDRLGSHLDAMFELIEALPSEASEFLSIDAPSLYPFCKWIARLQGSLDELEHEQLNDDAKRLKLSSFYPRLKKHRTLFEASLDEAVEEYRVATEQRLQVARVANCRFISAIKVFGEGGTYARQEAAKAAAALVYAADALETCVHKAYDNLIQRRSQLLGMADRLMSNFPGVMKELPINHAVVAPKKSKKR